ncbi:MAG: hypothetical protein AUI14_23330 [Actinobacteria bacterium 13_2_20CM_2_71_6]|nr:MAG: hypothetical protein AUI14_23330 [Actinobacteria bacterium 13_2_20CM_2_71_6]
MDRTRAAARRALFVAGGLLAVVLRLIDGTGKPIAGTRLVASRGPSRTLTLRLPTLGEGVYAVVWQVVTPAEGHPTGGILVFAVHSGGTVAGVSSGGGLLDAVRRWLALALLVGVVGGVTLTGPVLFSIRHRRARVALRKLRWVLRNGWRRPLTRLALLGAGLLFAAALYRAGQRTDSGSTGALVAETALLLGIGALALRGRPRWAATRAGTAAVALVAVATLVEPSSAAGGTPPTPPAAAPSTTGEVGDLVVSVSVSPNRPGVNGFTVRAASNRRPAPAPIDAVALELATKSGTNPVTLQQVEPGHYFGTGSVEMPGAVRLVAVISRAGARLTVPVDWSVAPPTAQRPGTAQAGPRAPVMTALAAGLLLSLLTISLWWLVLEGRRWRVSA